MWSPIRPSIGRAEAGIRRLLPFISDVAIDFRLGRCHRCLIRQATPRSFPQRSRATAELPYGCGFSGHGINPFLYCWTVHLASLVQRTRRTTGWSLPFMQDGHYCPPWPPTEPVFDTLGATIVRWGIMQEKMPEDPQFEDTPSGARAAAGLSQSYGSEKHRGSVARRLRGYAFGGQIRKTVGPVAANAIGRFLIIRDFCH